MFRKILIANRGVAAVRIARTLRRLGIPYAVVHSEADADLPFVAEAGERVCIGKPPARESYLRIDALIDAARTVGADAVHPGYGFLSESAEFCTAVQQAGLVFIGPRAEHIAAMGDKVAARAWMQQAGIPVLPATPPLQDVATAEAAAARLGFPLLVKASAGGGGVGMQRAARAEDLAGALERARSLALRAFGDGTVYLEKYVENVRHVEFQLAGDGGGGMVSLWERDCSVQRRNQKVIEEAPAPFLDETVSRDMGDRLTAALSRLAYASLGTVEMLRDADGNLHFLEMNTRLQVEHSVTEAVTGLDLVALQVGLAAGAAALPAVPPRHGHAVEARIYAEDPVRFRPSPGRLQVFRPPAGAGITVDAGYAEGNTVTPFYDPLLALVIAHGSDRTEAIARLQAALADFAIAGIKTNIPFVQRMLTSEEFVTGRHHTGFAEPFARAG